MPRAMPRVKSGHTFAMNFPRQHDPRVKIERAETLIGQLDALIDRSVKDRAYDVVGQPEPPLTGQNIPYVQFKDPLDPEIPCLTGDILHNLRSALDHLLFRLLPPTTDSREIRKRAFPIGQDAKHYNVGEKKRRLSALRPDLVTRIDALEPYKDGNGHALWQLHELNVIDKHRLLLTVGLAHHQVWRPRSARATSAV